MENTEMPSRVVISSSSFKLENNPGIELLRGAGLEITTNPFGRKLTETEIDDLLDVPVVGLLAGVEPLTAEVIANAAGLRVISRLGVGLDNVDLEAAKRREIPVYSTPDAPVDAVVEMTIGLILATLRHIPQSDRAVRAGDWPRSKGHLLKASTLGILGLGRIGRRVAQVCRGFGTRVIAHDPEVRDPQDAEWTELPGLLAEADILSLHLPHSAATHHLMGRETLSTMKRGSILINTARGGLVDEAALADSLRQGQLAAAGLDVFETEPYSGELLTFPQVVLTPHLASSAIESRDAMEREAAMNLYTGLCEAGVIESGTSA
jgi:D-3-phosphoglycerate dehydrogenase